MTETLYGYGSVWWHTYANIVKSIQEDDSEEQCESEDD